MNAERIEIGLKSGVPDARGSSVQHRVKEYFQLPLKKCVTRDVYKVDLKMTQAQVRKVRQAFTDPVVARSAAGRLKAPAFDWMLEIGYKPGVTDNVGQTARTVVADVLERELDPYEKVYTSVQYFFTAPDLTRAQVQHIAEDLLANTLIQTIRMFSAEEWAAAPVDDTPPAIHETAETDVQVYELSGSDEDLMQISREGILSLSLDEMHAVRAYYQREEIRRRREELGLPDQPTDIELECIAQTWSEHCSHKIFAGDIHYTDELGREEVYHSLYKTFIQAATRDIAQRIDWLVSVFTDNAGIIKFNDRLHLAYKVETHNSPSALDPYGGSITGIVGVNRDPMGTGMACSLLSNVWGYCLGSPFYEGDLPAGLMHPRRIRDGVHAGVIDGGNQSGIPWSRGFEVFDDRYIGKPLVYCGTLGTTPVDVVGGPAERKEIEVGDLLVMCGGRIGKDGIHGATFSSEELRQESPAQAVQIGDPITQRKMYEFLLEARDLGLFRCITDNGAGGLSCSAGEMGKFSGGVDIDLKAAPLKYEGLQPWEIFLSEAQERMTLAVPPGKKDEFLALSRRRDVESTVLGIFNDSGELLVRYGDRIIGCLDMNFLYEDGCPTMSMKGRWVPPAFAAPERPAGSMNVRLKHFLGRLNICSKEYKSRIYDGEVKGLSVIKPYIGVHQDIPADATVMRVEYDDHAGVALTEAINPFYSDIDTYHMTAAVIDLAVRRILAAGGTLDCIAGLDNFCWPDPVESEKTPDGAYKMAQLVRSNQALYDVTTALDVPCISGKDSMKNDSVRGGRKISIPPTLLFSTIGKIRDVRKTLTLDFKQPGDRIFILGQTGRELGASEYYRMLAEEQGRPDAIGQDVPRLDLNEAKAVYAALEESAADGLLCSAHALHVGGLALGLTMAALGGDLGAEVDLKQVPLREALKDDELLFSESCARFLVTCRPGQEEQLSAKLAGVPHACMGTVTDNGELQVKSRRGKTFIKSRLSALRKAWKTPLWGV